MPWFRVSAAFTLLLSLAIPVVADDWPQWMGPQRDGIWREKGVLKALPKGGPTVKWRTPIQGGYAGPAVADGRVYVFDYVTDGNRNADDPGTATKLMGKERLLCLDAGTGMEVWKYEYDCPYSVSYPAGPRCTPTVSGGNVYILGAMGDLACLDAKTGKKAWSKNLPKDYNAKVPMWGYAGHPLVEGNKLFTLAGGEGSIAVCLDTATGKEIWRALSAEQIGYCPPTMIQAGGVAQLLIWHAEALNSLDPASGKVYWSLPLVPNYGMAIMSPRKQGDLVYVGGIDKKSMLVKLDATRPAATVAGYAKGVLAISPVNSTPLVDGDYIYGVDQDGKLHCAQLADGKRLWSTSVPVTGEDAANSGTAFLVKNGELFYLFNELGELIIARLSPKGYDEVSRAKILAPTSLAFGRDVVWSHPAFANRCMYARNDREIVCVSLEDK